MLFNVAIKWPEPIFTSTNAGKVIRPATAAHASTAFFGTLFLSTFDHLLEPGTAPSRLKANIILEALVNAEVQQKS